MRPTMPRARGFSIVELLISVAIGLLALVLASRLITGSQSAKASALGTSDSMQSGMLAMFSISADAQQAGFGLNDPLLLGCNTRFVDNRDYAMAPAILNGVDEKTPLAPAIIQSGGNGSDTITLYSGGSNGGTGTMRVVADTFGNQLNLDQTPYGFAEGDVVVVAPEDRVGDCALTQVSAAPNNSKALSVTDTGSQFRFNDGGLGAAFKGGKARVFHLGPPASLSFHTWSVEDGFLLLSSTNMAPSGAPVTVADNIVAIKAQYGFDQRSSATFNPKAGIKVGTWSSEMIDADGNAVIGNRGDYERITALRIAVVARSKTRANGPAGGCTATPVKPRVFATSEPTGTAAVPVDIDVGGADWKCYHYRVFETIVPIRNANWRP